MQPAAIMIELSGVISRFAADCAKPYTGQRALAMDLRISN